MTKLSSGIVDDETWFKNEISDIKERFMVFENESNVREAKANNENSEINGKLYGLPK